MPIPVGGQIQNNGAGAGTFPSGGNNDAAVTKAGNTPASVTVARIELDDNSGNYVASPGCWADFYIQSRYEGDYHRYMAGMTSPGGFRGGTAAFFQLAAPTLLWIVEWTAAKWLEVPEIPDPNISQSANGGGWVLLDTWFETSGLSADGTGHNVLYRISGTYVYGQKSPPASLINSVSFPRMPMWKDVFQRTVPASSLVQGLTTVNQPLGRVNS